MIVHGVRWAADLAYSDIIENALPNDKLIGEFIRGKLTYYPTVTREPFRNNGRISLLMSNGKLFADVSLPPMRPEDDRFMLCGSPTMLADLRAILKEKHFVEGNHGAPGHYVIEKAFVEG